MKENDKLNVIEVKLKNLTYIVITGFVIIGLLIIGLYFTGGATNVLDNSDASKDSSSDYDVSKMKKLTGSEAAKLFEQEGIHFLYIGRPGCSVCVSLVPELNEAIDETKITMNYLEVGENFRNEFADLFDHLDIETTINKEEGTYGSLLKEHGYTPIVVVIKDGKMVDGFVGSRDSETLVEFFKKYI